MNEEELNKISGECIFVSDERALPEKNNGL